MNYIENNEKILNKNFVINKESMKDKSFDKYNKYLKSNFYGFSKNNEIMTSRVDTSNVKSNENVFSSILFTSGKDINLSEYKLTPFYGENKNIFRTSNINDLNKSMSLNVKNSNDNYENHTFKRVKNVILSNDGKDIENNYDYSTDIIFKDNEQKINQEEVLKIISQRQRNMEIEIENIIDKKIKNQGDEINITTISSQVYRDIERKMKYEKRRKGMI